MKKMMEQLQSKFDDLAETNEEPSVEVVAERRAHKQTEAEISNPRKNKGKGKVNELPQKSAPKPPRKDTSASQPSRMEKATDAFKFGCPSNPQGKTVLRGRTTKAPKPRR
uniref:Uncharacterized protein n=1 Tax=Cannabis sativa TaxID=3483 RepID=A0A803QCD3_CANSA